MSDSATLNRRARKMQHTAEQLTAVTRRLTAERGLAGFTIEEVCEEVDVSRRTFFNYFSTKEDAVIGADSDDEAQRFSDYYLGLGARGWHFVLDDLVSMIVTQFEQAGIDAQGHAQFLAALEREPRLLVRFMGITRDRERQAAAVVAQREGVPADDPRAEAAVSLLATLIRTSAERFLDPSNTKDFSTIMTDALAAFRSVLAEPSGTRKAQP